MNEQPTYTPPTEPTKPNSKVSRIVKTLGIVLLVIIALGGVGYSVYAWQQTSNLSSNLDKKEIDNTKLRNEISSLKASIEDMNHESDATDMELAQKAAQNYIDAQVLDTKYVAIAPASVKGDFASFGVAPASKPSFITQGLIVKKINESWVVIYSGQNGPDQNIVTKFAIPKEFQQ
jgi:hypothetical protein